MSAKGRVDDKLLQLLRYEATLSEPKDLLHIAKYRQTEDEVRVSVSLDEAILEIRRAVGQGALQWDDVVSWLQQAEENGNQHILYYRPRNTQIARGLADGERVAELIFEHKHWQERNGFPLISMIPSTAFVWTDFRIGLPGISKDWVAKLYDRETRTEPVPIDEWDHWKSRLGVKLPENWEFQPTRTVPHRSVVLARWNHPDLLEIRVSRRGVVSPGTIKMRVQALEKKT